MVRRLPNIRHASHRNVLRTVTCLRHRDVPSAQLRASHSYVLRTVTCYAQLRASHSDVLRTGTCFAQLRASHSYVLRTVTCFAQGRASHRDVLRTGTCFAQGRAFGTGTCCALSSRGALGVENYENGSFVEVERYLGCCGLVAGALALAHFQHFVGKRPL